MIFSDILYFFYWLLGIAGPYTLNI